jgi:hypothetical protein
MPEGSPQNGSKSPRLASNPFARLCRSAVAAALLVFCLSMAQAADEPHKDGSSRLAWLFIGGNDLHRYCQPEESEACAAYITGVSDTLQVFMSNNSIVPCILRIKILS